MLRIISIFALTASSAAAEICDRSKFNLAESIDSDGAVSRDRIEFEYESGVVHLRDGARETVYCIKNNHDEFPVYVRWHGPNPDRLFDDYAVAGGKWAAKIKKRYEDTEPGDRTLEFGTTSSLGYEEEAETLLFVSERSQLPLAEQEAILLRAQATPLDLMQRTFPEVLQDTAQLTEFLQAYRASPQGGDTISIYSYSAGWVPADTEAFARMASGEPLEGYDGPYVPISYGV